MSLQLFDLSPAIGCEVRGLDLTRPLDDADVAALREAFDRRHMLVVRGQRLTADDQRRLVGYFGPVADEHLDGSHVAYVSNKRPDGIVPEGELVWHSDFTFTPYPVESICLYGYHLSGPVSPTRFASTARGYQALPAELKERIQDLSCLHIADFSGAQARFDRRGYTEFPQDTEAFPRTVQPLVFRHPRTGERLLFVNEWFAMRIEGMTAGESEELLQRLFAVLYDERYVYAHHWQPDDLVLWDNLVCQHSRRKPSQATGAAPSERTLRRVIISPGYPKMIEMIPSLKESMINRRAGVAI